MKILKGIRSILIMVFILGSICNATAQQDIATTNTLKKMAPITPDAASLGKYGAFPVSLYTGIPNISIPLYEIELNDFKLPISLSYHAGGIKVEDIASSVGLGWTLNAGGVINRQQRGVPDEIMIDNYNLYQNSVAQMNDPTVSSNAKTAIASNWGGSGAIDRGYDTEPDIFSFNFLNENGKFFHDPQGNAYMMPVNNRFTVKHEDLFYITDSRRYRWARWIITDNAGIKYVFGRSLDGLNDNIEQTCQTGVGLSCDDNTSVNSWFLSEIILADGRKITYTYDISSYSCSASGVYTVMMPNSCYAFGGNTNINTSIVYKRALRLKEITFPGGKISFVPGQGRTDLPGEKYIDKIEVYKSSTTGSTVTYTRTKAFQLNYSNSQRLKLLSVGEIDISTNKVVKPYSFDYNGTTLPDRSSMSQDLWGYYNAQNNSTLLPEIYTSSSGSTPYLSGANRSVDSKYTQAELLSSITYPTGGRSDFQYENNTITCDYEADAKTLCSVLSKTSKFPLITRIISYQSSNPGNSSYRTYSNDFALPSSKGGRSERSITFSGHYLPYDNSTCTAMDMTGGGRKYLCIEAALEKKNPDNTYSPVFGGLTFGINYDIDPALGDTFRLSVYWPNTLNGMFYVDTHYKTEDVSDQLNISKGEMFAGGLRIKKITNYDPVTQNTVIKRYEYKYDNDDIPGMNGVTSGVLMNVPMLNFNEPQCFSNSSGQAIYCGSVYGFTSRSMANILSADGINVGYKKVTEYTDSSNINGKSVSYFTTALDFTDGNLDYATQFPFPETRSVEWKRGLEISKGDYKKLGDQIQLLENSENAYAFYPVAGNYKELNATKITLIPVGGGSTTGNGCTTGYMYSQYKIGTESFYLTKNTHKFYADQNSYLDKTVSFLQDTASLQTSTINTTTSAGDVITTKVTYPLNYSTGMPVLSTDAAGIKRLITNNMVTTPIEKLTIRKDVNGNEFVTDGNITAFYPDRPLVSKIYVLKQKNIPISDFISSKINANGDFVKDSRYEERFTFNLYDENFNIQEQQKNGDAKECYIWGYANKYPVARIIGADYNTVAALVNPSVLQNPASDQQLRDELNKIRTSLNDQHIQALVNTYTYLPLTGLTSETSPSGNTTYYEYDNLGRLKLIKDKDGKILKQFEYQYQVPVTQ